MSDYQPKVGDLVMVGEAGVYAVASVERHGAQVRCHIRNTSEVEYCVPAHWLTPAPELRGES